jgi:hypothetical protein
MPDDAPYSLIRSPNRSMIQTLIPDCTLEEVYEDKIQITSHPVEKGANISDHAFMLPKTLEMKIAWADYKGNTGTMHSMLRYRELMQLQEKLDPLTIDTHRRSYTNMLIESIAVTVDQKTASGVVATVRLREVRQADVLTNDQTKPTPAKDQQVPQVTQPVTDLGRQTPPPAGVTNTPPPAGLPPDASQVIISNSQTPPI